MKTKSPTRPEQRAANGSREAFTGGRLQGTIVSVHPGRDLLVLRARGTKRTLVIRWTPETQFAFEGRPSSSEKLRSGQQARIHCRVANYELKAENISIASSESCPAQHVGPVPSPGSDPALPALRSDAKSLSLHERLRTYHPDR